MNVHRIQPEAMRTETIRSEGVGSTRTAESGSAAARVDLTVSDGGVTGNSVQAAGLPATEPAVLTSSEELHRTLTSEEVAASDQPLSTAELPTMAVYNGRGVRVEVETNTQTQGRLIDVTG